ESPRLDAEILLGRAIDMPRSYFFAHPEDVPDEAALERLEHAVARRLAGEPMAYITGSKEFWSMELLVTPATLVPRPETEILVDRALAHIPRKAEWRVLDLGTGSGAIALAIARERPLCEVVATDISAEALRVAEANARELGIPNITFAEGDWTEAVAGRTFDVIVSNPPYVESADPALAALAAEPRAALAAGEDGLDAIRVLARDCRPLLADDGLFALEHGSGQPDAVAALLKQCGWQAIECHKDYAGLPRVTTARKTC
ncbi:MAG: peptide chain release factor N(5)-glutamine methyltransferase, partial [Woeseiaceae bacterium]|nr:peptide chain release factor N(5)-glutamine methyltransferase [Woeseiaceae bacterium]